MQRINYHKLHGKSKEKRKSKKFLIVFLIIFTLGTSIILIKKGNNKDKKIKIGNNSSSQEIVEYILNISSYEAQIEVEVKSNKNSNKYKLKQKYINSQNNEQEVLEPSNIQGVKIIRKNDKLKIENTQLSLTKIIENYQEITQNNLDLANFIENYKNNSNSKFKEEENQIVMETTAKTGNNYQKYEKLYVSKKDGKPIKMEIKDTNQNTIIYIKYNEIDIKSENENLFLPCPIRNTEPLLKKGYKFSKDKIWRTKLVTVYPAEYFCPIDYVTGEKYITNLTKSIHHYSASWHNKEEEKIHKIQEKCIKVLGIDRGKKVSRILDFPYRIKLKYKKLGLIGTLRFAQKKLKNN